jgi:hypothetical protein
MQGWCSKSFAMSIWNWTHRQRRKPKGRRVRFNLNNLACLLFNLPHSPACDGGPICVQPMSNQHLNTLRQPTQVTVRHCILWRAAC